MENKHSIIDPSEAARNARDLRKSLYSPKKSVLRWCRYVLGELAVFVLAILAIGVWALFALALTLK